MSALVTLTASALYCVLGDEQVDEQIRLRERIEELKYEIEELRSQMSQPTNKEEGMCIVGLSSLVSKSYF